MSEHKPNYQGVGCYQHYKGKLYIVTGTREASLDHEVGLLVDYEDEFGERFGTTMARFNEWVNYNGYPRSKRRFTSLVAA